MTQDYNYQKTPELIDAELEIAFSEKKALISSIAVLSVVLILMLTVLFVLIRANTGLFPRYQIAFTSNAAAVCVFSDIAERGDVTDAFIENHAAFIARELHLLDYVNFRSTLARVMDAHFTAEARSATTTAMLSSGVLRAVVEQGFVVRALPSDRPRILRQGVVDGVYSWQVMVPVTIAYAHRGQSNAPTYRPEERHIYMTIIRTEPTAMNPQGLLVSRLLSLQPTDSFVLEEFVQMPAEETAITTESLTPTTD